MKTGLRQILSLLGCVAAHALAGPAHAITGPPPFQVTAWSADRIIIGTAVSVDGEAAQVAVETYLRDRTRDAPQRIHARRSTGGGCVVLPPRPYDEGFQYLLFMQEVDVGGRETGAGGAGRDSLWLITWELRLPIPGLCVEPTFGPMPAPDTGSRCDPVIPTKMFLDALASFDDCFGMGLSRFGVKTVTSQSCTDEELEQWIARSPIHAWLAEKALGHLQGPSDARPADEGRLQLP